ncbi:hypothetical protein [Streptomyces sp. NPDC057617]|uniref:hypothetical protein n=1 Tax=Streptomyces sp. NPDC057617 TaxID=3346184 RepID=UPI0036801464
MPLDLKELPTASPSVPRDGWGRPLVVPKGGGKPRSLTRTTTFIDCIEDKSALSDWRQRMTLMGTARRPALLDMVRQLDPDDASDKRRLNTLAEQAADIAGASVKRKRGTHLHTLSEYVDRGEELPASSSPSDVADMAAYKVETVDFDVVAVEQFVVVDELGAGGTFDRMLRYSGPGPEGEHIEGLFIGDLKTGSVRHGRLKMAAQLAVYSRGELYDHTLCPVDDGDKKALAAWKKSVVPANVASAAYAPVPAVNKDWGIIIHLPAGEARCTLYWADLRLGWEAARLALDLRRMRSAKSALVQFNQR